MRRAWLLAAALTAGLPAAALAQFSPGARSAAMGGAGMVFASGVDAIEWNPANLALEGGWNVSLGEAGAAALLSGFTFDDLQEIYDAGGAGGYDVSNAPAGGLSFSTVTEGFTTAQLASMGGLPQPGSPFPSIGITVGSLGLRVRSRIQGDFRLSKEVVDLMVNGFDPAEIQSYRVGNTGFRTASFSEITVGYGAILGDRLALGVGARYVRGHSLTEGRFFEPVVDLVNETVEVAGVAVESAGGSGYALDLGLALDLVAGLRVSASGSNVVQSMTWDEALVSHEAVLVGCNPGTPACPDGDDFESGIEDLIDRFQSQPVDPEAMSLPVYFTAQDLFRGAFFPTVFRLGVGWRAGGTAVELVGSSVSPRGRQHSQWDERVSLGLEQRLWILTLRAGAAKGTDGLQALSGGLGLGIGPVALDVS
ncbi:MAG TPA: DUF5723 family protein, partial [Longimicrobiales bacterium]|nr:DUF5723 family protein [Longimicrobiales bacterium]